MKTAKSIIAIAITAIAAFGAASACAADGDFGISAGIGQRTVKLDGDKADATVLNLSATKLIAANEKSWILATGTLSTSFSKFGSIAGENTHYKGAEIAVLGGMPVTDKIGVYSGYRYTYSDYGSDARFSQQTIPFGVKAIVNAGSDSFKLVGVSAEVGFLFDTQRRGDDRFSSNGGYSARLAADFNSGDYSVSPYFSQAKANGESFRESEFGVRVSRSF